MGTHSRSGDRGEVKCSAHVDVTTEVDRQDGDALEDDSRQTENGTKTES